MHESARLDAEVLLAHTLDVSRAHLRAWPEKPLDDQSESRFRDLVERRAHGEPVAYLIGYQEFWSLRLAVTPATLIPRPETELLVEQSLARIPADEHRQIADLGAGSGAVALAIAHDRPACEVVGVERDSDALSVARDNAQRLHIENVSFRHGDWFEPLEGQRFDLIVSNPPYVAETDPHLQQGDVRFEPRHALRAGPAGLVDLSHIISIAPSHLHDGGWLCVEHGYDQASALVQLLQDAGFVTISQYHDLAGHVRVSCAQRPSSDR